MHVVSRVVRIVHNAQRFCHLIVLVVACEDDYRRMVPKSFDRLLRFDLYDVVDSVVRWVQSAAEHKVLPDENPLLVADAAISSIAQICSVFRHTHKARHARTRRLPKPGAYSDSPGSAVSEMAYYIVRTDHKIHPRSIPLGLDLGQEAIGGYPVTSPAEDTHAVDLEHEG